MIAQRLAVCVLGVTGFAIVASLLLWSGTGCNEEPPPSLYDPNSVSGAQPVVTSVDPPAGGLAGVTLITITGSNFSSIKQDNLVFFDATLAQVLQASPTQLQVRAPNLVKDSVNVKIAVMRSELFSEVFYYRLEGAVFEIGNFSKFHEPIGIAADTGGNVFVSALFNGGRDSTYKITSQGAMAAFSIGFSSSVPRWAALKVGPDGIYAAALRNAIFLIPLTGGNSALWLLGGALGIVYDFDFDQQGNIWAGGNNTAIYRVTPAKIVKAFPFVGDVRSARVFQGRVYLAAKVDTVWGVWRFPIISADSLGPLEQYFNFTAAYGAANGAYAITFTSDGDMFIGTDAAAGSLIVVHPDRTSEVFYAGVLKAQSLLFTYDRGTNLYITRTGNAADNADKKIIRVNTQKMSAPYYGRGDP